MLSGGAGNDTFSAILGADVLTDGDTITNFTSGAAADTTQRFLCNTTTGVLTYDGDGSGLGAAVTLATLNVRTLASMEIIIF
jgi:hypothetical protein